MKMFGDGGLGGPNSSDTLDMHLNFLNFLNLQKILRSLDLVCDQHLFGFAWYQRCSLAVKMAWMV